MASIINADDGAVSGSSGIKLSSDTSGQLDLQTNGVTAISVSSSQAVSFGATSSLDFSGSLTLSGGTANGVLYLNGSKVATSGSALVFDGTNLGLGVTPSSVAVSDKVLQVNKFLFNDNTNGYGILRYNNYYNGTNDVYYSTGAASAFQMAGNAFRWYQAASGTAGDPITFTTAMVLDSSGQLGIGTSSPGQKLEVVGNISATGVSSGTRYIGTLNETSAYTGALALQAGGGSAGWGGGVVMYGHSHATYPGGVWIGRSVGASGPIMFGSGGIGPSSEQMRLGSTGGLSLGTSTTYQNNFINNNFCTTGRMYSGADALFGHNVYADPNSRVIKQLNNGYYAAWIRMYYNQGIFFGTSTVAGSAGDTVGDPAGTTNEKMVLTNGGSLLVGTTTAYYSSKIQAWNGPITTMLPNIDANYGDAFIAGYTGNSNERNIIRSAVSLGATFSGFQFMISDGGGSSNVTESFRINRTSCTVIGSLSKGSGSFKIDHPLKPDTHHLVHSFIEGPQADLIYRGKATLVNGRAEVNIDAASGMTEGTFVALCRDVQCFTSNESDWDAVRGSVSGNTLTIECQNPNSTATISWMVVGERQDKHMYDTDWTDENGKVIVEPEKPEAK